MWLVVIRYPSLNWDIIAPSMIFQQHKCWPAAPATTVYKHDIFSRNCTKSKEIWRKVTEKHVFYATKNTQKINVKAVKCFERKRVVLFCSKTVIFDSHRLVLKTKV